MGDLHDAKIDPSSRTLCKMDDNLRDISNRRHALKIKTIVGNQVKALQSN